MGLRLVAPALVAALILVAAPPARADADPASDVLYTQRIYLPFFNGKVSPAQAQTLKNAVDSAWAKGFQVKIALIPGPNDLGGIYQLYGKPQTYADFLGRELVFLFKGVLITVMPQGIGVYQYKHSTARQQALVAKIAIPKGADGLATAGTIAVAKLAGTKVPNLPKSSSDSGSGTPGWMIALIAAGGLAVIGAMIAFGPRVVRKKPA
jgi:hypothetical protein